MTKKGGKKSKKKSTAVKGTSVEKALIKNFISLQKAITNLAVKFEHLSDRMSKLLDIFEVSAKALAEKDFDFEKSNEDISDKLDELIDQNRTIARGLTLMHETSGMGHHEQRPPVHLEPPKPIASKRSLFPLAKKQRKMPMMQQRPATREAGPAGYQASITTGQPQKTQAKPKKRSQPEQEPDEFADQYLPENQEEEYPAY